MLNKSLSNPPSPILQRRPLGPDPTSNFGQNNEKTFSDYYSLSMAPSNLASMNSSLSEYNASSLVPSVILEKSMQMPNTSHFAPKRS